MFNRKLLGGFVLGICATLMVMWIYRMFLLEKHVPYAISINVTDSMLGKVKIKEIVKDLEQTESTIEKINSVSKRIDDILIFGGVIVTLLIAINVGVYIKAESEVEKHFKDNFEKVKEKVEKRVNEIEQIATKAQIEFAAISALKEKVTMSNSQSTNQ
ncbi:hypothetical protein CLV59_105132 [Chitinophaga dinghuensis]|uniref:Uncharacterized protein n=1 Tax=Chitinophaga dinghuensis TaxID=1539050 RepID=A0A327VYR2_9BACT|nr:hypothetical protein [Chitinophaga dinghuensis]RAJ80025.1 hypothetical protein CLV59_105132 [Chitinophaga dinghuensis]